MIEVRNSSGYANGVDRGWERMGEDERGWERMGGDSSYGQRELSRRGDGKSSLKPNQKHPKMLLMRYLCNRMPIDGSLSRDRAIRSYHFPNTLDWH